MRKRKEETKKSSHRGEEIQKKTAQQQQQQHPWITQKPKESIIQSSSMMVANAQHSTKNNNSMNRQSANVTQQTDKLKLLQEKRNQYFLNKQTEELYQSEKEQFFKDSSSSASFRPQLPSSAAAAAASSSSLPLLPAKPLANPPPPGNQQLDHHTDQLLQQLTYKLTHHIQENLMKQQVNTQLQEHDVCDTIISRIDEFVARELSSFCCPICYETMIAPRLPTLLFPCGHTFCQVCIEQHTQDRGISARTMANEGRSRVCPYCRVKIDSKAINQPLKELIDQFSSQKGKIEKRNGNFQDLFISQKSSSSGKEQKESQGLSSPRERIAPSQSQKQPRSHYHHQHQSYEMRYQILKNELDELLIDQDSVQRKKQNIQFATNHLVEEKEKVANKIKLLYEEQELIDKHLENQQKKMHEIEEQERISKQKTDLIQNTLTNLLKEMDKLKLLAQGIEADEN